MTSPASPGRLLRAVPSMPQLVAMFVFRQSPPTVDVASSPLPRSVPAAVRDLILGL